MQTDEKSPQVVQLCRFSAQGFPHTTTVDLHALAAVRVCACMCAREMVVKLKVRQPNVEGVTLSVGQQIYRFSKLSFLRFGLATTENQRWKKWSLVRTNASLVLVQNPPQTWGDCLPQYLAPQTRKLPGFGFFVLAISKTFVEFHFPHSDLFEVYSSPEAALNISLDTEKSYLFSPEHVHHFYMYELPIDFTCGPDTFDKLTNSFFQWSSTHPPN